MLPSSSPSMLPSGSCVLGQVMVVALLCLLTFVQVQSELAAAKQSAEPNQQSQTTTMIPNGGDKETAQSQDVKAIPFDLEAALQRSRPPVIGVLSQVMRDYKRLSDTRQTHIVASYVKWIEAAGGQVIGIKLNQDDSYYEHVFNITNGLLLPGGDNLLDPTKRTPMLEAAKKLYKLAVDANQKGDFYPIWGTCLGMELLTVLSSNKNRLATCRSNDVVLSMDFRQRGRLFAPTTDANLPISDELGYDYAETMMNALSTKPLTYNFHHKCITDDGLERAKLTQFYEPLSYSKDKDGLKFITIFEARDYPFYGVQFHPEKPPFEFVVKKSQQNVPHSSEAMAASRYFADYFIRQARRSGHHLELSELAPELIYAQTPNYTAPKRDMYQQRYMWPYEPRQGISDEEFVDSPLPTGARVSEAVTHVDSSSDERSSSPKPAVDRPKVHKKLIDFMPKLAA